MEKTQKNTFFILLILGLIYFCLMIPANLTGAKTPEMLAVFEVDEYAQYEHVIRMLTPGETFYQTIRNFFVYLHYFYGYPFYFLSAILLFPLKLLSGSGWPSDTQLIVCWLRQTVSVLPMILAAGFLVWITTRFKNKVLSAGLFLFLLTIPGVILNNFWWHPDSLAVLLIVLVIFFLDRDRLRFGRSFYTAAAVCGVALGTKYAGMYFILAVPVYLIIGILREKISLKKAVLQGLVFILIMAVFLLISNPLLLLPQERAEIIRTQQLQFEQTGTGIFVTHQTAFLENGNLPSDIRLNYAETWFFILAFGGLFLGFRRSREEKVISSVTLAYLVVTITVIILAATRRLHYFLPVVLPLFAFLPNLINETGSGLSGRSKRIPGILFTLLILLQWIPNLAQTVSLYRTQLSREAESPSIRLYEQVKNEIIPGFSIPGNRMLRIFRDWKIYFPEQDGIAIKMDWNMATLELIQEWDPELILLEQENIKMFGDPAILGTAVDTGSLQPVSEFYAMAGQDTIPGYRKTFENSFAVVFEKNKE
ncbi:MAG: hypothetical protein AB9907_15765 [Flexilinea sp.]